MPKGALITKQENKTNKHIWPGIPFGSCKNILRILRKMVIILQHHLIPGGSLAFMKSDPRVY